MQLYARRGGINAAVKRLYRRILQTPIAEGEADDRAGRDYGGDFERRSWKGEGESGEDAGYLLIAG